MIGASPQAREVAKALALASDNALGRVVRLVDGMACRAEVDLVLASIRPRLSRLRPARPITVNRLLFLPLEGVLVDAIAWRRGSGQVPRQALVSLAEALHQAAPVLVADIAAFAHGLSFEDKAQVSRLGALLWSGAGQAMPQQPPSGWAAATGLRAEDYPPLAALCVGVWRHAEGLWAVLDQAEDALSETLIRAALAGPAQESEVVFAASLSLLLLRGPSPGSIASIAAGIDPRARVVAGVTLDRMIDAGVPALEAGEPARAAGHVERLAGFLADLESCTLGKAPERRERLQKLRREADAACRAIFSATLETGMLAPLETLLVAAGEAEVMALESRVRDLRRLLMACREVGTPERYDRAAREAVERLVRQAGGLSAGGGDGPGMTRVDMARLAEILAGPEEAERLLAASGR